jgi:hypothetical protein
MNKIFYILTLVVLVSVSTKAQDNPAQVKSNEPASKAVITFESLVHDYGEIEQEGNGECVFTFTNTGSETLLLTNVKASCGCTAPSWSRDPIKPGEKGNITVKYNTRIVGTFNKSITVTTNGDPSQVMLRIKGSVKQKEQPGEQK